MVYRENAIRWSTLYYGDVPIAYLSLIEILTKIIIHTNKETVYSLPRISLPAFFVK
jgi:hypothetical protein